jgi:hypothetical protein
MEENLLQLLTDVMNKLLYKELYLKFDPDIPDSQKLNVSNKNFNFFSGILADDEKIFARNSLYITKK